MVGNAFVTNTCTLEEFTEQAGPPEIFQRKIYFPGINPETETIFESGLANIAVLGPLTCDHLPLPDVGRLPTKLVFVTLQARR